MHLSALPEWSADAPAIKDASFINSAIIPRRTGRAISETRARADQLQITPSCTLIWLCSVQSGPPPTPTVLSTHRLASFKPPPDLSLAPPVFSRTTTKLTQKRALVHREGTGTPTAKKQRKENRENDPTRTPNLNCPNTPPVLNGSSYYVRDGGGRITVLSDAPRPRRMPAGPPLITVDNRRNPHSHSHRLLCSGGALRLCDED